MESRPPLKDNFVRAVTDDLIEAYLGDDRPWIIGFSGGKDSTALLQLVYYAIARLNPKDRRKRIYAIASDTRVEMPVISERLKNETVLVQQAAEQDGLPISAHIVFPKLNDTFWVNMVGRGYPSPTSKFRWCTDRLKIKPVSEFVQRVVCELGEVVIVLGARRSESATRAQTMSRYELPGNRFRPHSDLPKALVYTPIADLTTDDIWTYLLQARSPWGGDNRGLLTLYRCASGECPLVIDVSTPSCGNSRFGCWTCTVVDRDRSMESLIESGKDHLAPLLELRDYLKDLRDAPGARYDERRNGTTPRRRGTSEIMTNTGPFTHAIRKEILRRVLAAQKDAGISLIEGDELTLIQEIWNKEETQNPRSRAMPVDTVTQIWNHVYEGQDMPDEDKQYENLCTEDQLLLDVCREHDLPFELMSRLREIEEKYGHLRRRHGLPDDMREAVRAFASFDCGE